VTREDAAPAGSAKLKHRRKWKRVITDLTNLRIRSFLPLALYLCQLADCQVGFKNCLSPHHGGKVLFRAGLELR
jgi:hypothetical protein